jgi:predicted ATP-dependent serine protease
MMPMTLVCKTCHRGQAVIRGECRTCYMYRRRHHGFSRLQLVEQREKRRQARDGKDSDPTVIAAIAEFEARELGRLVRRLNGGRPLAS